jgi:hypothetical protein
VTDNVIHLPVIQPTREQTRSRRKRVVRAKVESMKRITKGVLSFDKMLADAIYEELGPIDRPRTRDDCAGGERPCPFVSCAHHLYLEVTDKGAVKYVFPDVAPDALERLPATCALDVADDGGATLERTGELMNLTRERVRQLEVSAAGDFIAKWKAFGFSADPDQFVVHREGALATLISGRTLAVAPDLVEDEEDAEPDVAPRAIWDLRRDETREREQSAQNAVFRAYINDSIAHGIEATEERFAARLATTEQRLAAWKAKNVEQIMLSPSRIEEVFAEVERGEDRATAIAEKLGLSTCTMYLKTLAEEDRVQKHGSGPHTRWTLPGAMPKAAEKPARKPSSGQKKTASVPRVKVSDVSVAASLSPARAHEFTVRIGELSIDCRSAEQVRELALAFGKAS